MRAVNLIPPEQRRDRAAARTGPLSYVVIGVLAAVLIGVSLLVMTGNQVSEHKAELAQLEDRRDAAQTRAESLSPFAEFASMEEARTATVTTLAQSRFDWERVIRELSLVLPDDVWLTGLEATVSPDVAPEGGVDVPGRQSVSGPALELVGCTVSQVAVGRFVATLRDIDGVTRVSAFKAELPDDITSASAGASTSAEAGAASSGATEDCRTRDFITRFEIVVAFDEVPAPEAPAPEATAPATAEGAAPPAGSESQAAVQEGVAEGQEAANLAPGA